MIRFFARSRRNIFRESGIWFLSFIIAFQSFFNLLPLLGIPTSPTEVQAAVTNNGVLMFGDTSNAGQLKIRPFTNPSTFATEIVVTNGAGTASNIVHLTAKNAPTREEMMIGKLKVDGQLNILSCTTGCDAAADYTSRWDNTGTTATQDCDSVPTLDTCTQAFDIGYESLSGKAMVVYADNVAATVYYALWDGSTWSPNTTPGTPGVSNDILTNSGGPTCAGTPKWIRVIPAGDNLADDRSNRLMMLVSDSNADLCAFYWDGSTWDAGTTLFSTLGLCDRALCFDGDWQGNNTFIVSYTNSAANELRYQKYTVGTGWGGDTLMYAASSAQMWVTATSDPTSSRIYVSTATQAENIRAFVWRADDVTDGWTECASGGCPDTTTETVGSNISYPAFERFNGEGFNIYLDAGNGTALTAGYLTYTPSSTWGTRVATGMTPTDDYMQVKAVASPNSDDIMLFALDVDCDLDAQMWNGSALEAVGSNLDLLISSTNNTCANATPIEGMSVGYAVDFSWKTYSAWQRNWRFYDGADTNNTPLTGNGLAAENTTPTNFEFDKKFRLRVNYAERTLGASSTDHRKKLQFTSGCNPNTALETTCTWTDVDDAAGAGIWRYNTSGNCASCSDGTLLAGVVLTGSNATCTAGNGCGTWVLDKDAAAGANMDHNLNIIQESEWIVEPNSTNLPAYNTTYYFRIYDVGLDTPIYREQDASDCGAGSAACTYPSLTTQAAPNVALLHYRFINDDGSETTATNKQAEDIAHTGQAKNENLRLRFLVRNSGGRAALYNYRLAFSAVSGTCDTGLVGESYSDVPDGGAVAFDMALTANYVDQAASTNVASRLTDPAGTFNAGKLVEETSNQASSITLPIGSTTNQFTELEYNFIATSNATDSGQYCFILRNSTTNLDSYSVVGDLTIAGTAGPTTDQVLRHGNWWNAGTEQDFFWAK